MAITAPRKLSDFSGLLSAHQAGPVFAEAKRQSMLMQLARQMPLAASGEAITVTTSKPTAAWADEGAEKGKTQGGRGFVTMSPKKLTAIVVNSKEVVRANPGGYITDLYGDLAEAFAIAFDYAGFHGLGGDGTGSGPFEACLADTTKAVTFGTGLTIHHDLNDGLRQLVNDGKKLTGFAFGDIVEPLFNDAVDQNNRPLYIDSMVSEETASIVRKGRTLGRPCLIGEGINDGSIVGFGGNFNKAKWGVVGGISYQVSTEASVTINGNLVSLFENNLVAILAEAEYGFVMEDDAHFVKYLQADES